MKNFPNIAIQVPDILLPKSGISLSKWAVIACDQFTSQPEYWQEVKDIVGASPSTYNMILPEVYLGKPEESELIERTHQKMFEYLQNELFDVLEGFILVERTVSGKKRHGLVLALDLEHYDYNKGSQSLIRATEGTILQRLPPRMKIREGAPLELPHILVLIDDPIGVVIEPMIEKKVLLHKIYDFELMLGSGHLNGYLVDQEQDIEQITNSLAELAKPESFYKKYNVDKGQSVLLFAMGDGNHSLATAKAIWENLKPNVSMDHPARYALVEIENIHDPGLVFEPIHRIVFNLKEDAISAMRGFFSENFDFRAVDTAEEMMNAVDFQKGNAHSIGLIQESGFGLATIQNPKSNLPVGTIQSFLDDWLEKKMAGEIDYVHGFEPVQKLGSLPKNLGIYLPAMEKSDLFKTVILDGALPRKTFSMGEAHEKRFYMESRRITK